MAANATEAKTKNATGAAAKRTAATPASTPLANIGSGKNFWTVELIRPKGASAGLTSFIAMAEAAIQTAVDLLGRGMPIPPPQVDDLLKPALYKTLGAGEASEAYRKAIDDVEARQTSLRMMDSKVIKTSVTVAAEQNQTLRSIKNIVADLNTALKAKATIPKLKPPQELDLLNKVATAVERVYDKVNAVAKLNEDVANGDSTNSGGQAQKAAAGGGGGGGDGGLGSLVQMLGMLPMMAMPLLSQLPELLKKEDDPNAEQQDGSKTKQPGTTPPPGDPNTPPPGAPAAPPTGAGAPGEGQPTPNATENNGSGANAPAPGSPATQVSTGLGIKPAARTRPPTDRLMSADGTQPVDDDADNEEEATAVAFPVDAT